MTRKVVSLVGDKMKNTNELMTEEYVLYKSRWIMLILFTLSSVGSLMQWIQYSIIADVLVKYYGVSYDAANWTSMVYLLFYVPFVFVANDILSIFGLRVGVILGSLGTCLGAWIKLGSTGPGRFWVLLTGQSVVAISQVFVLPIPSLLAAEWFGAHEVSLACSLGLAGIQIGTAIGFVFPPIVIKIQNDLEDIGKDMYQMALILGIICTVNSLLIIFFFRDKPPSPPSKARSHALKNVEKSSTLQSIMRLLTNRSYVLLLLVYGMDIGVYYVVSAMLNQVVLKYYPAGSEDAGRIGFLITLAGAVALLPYGIILDKCKLYKKTLLATQILCSTTMFMCTFLLDQGIIFVYLSYILFGAFVGSVMVIGYEVGIEITYPEPEGTTAGLLIASAQVFGIAFTYLYSFLFYKLDDMWSNLSLCIIFLIGFILIKISPFELRRQAVNSKKGFDNPSYSNDTEIHL